MNPDDVRARLAMMMQRKNPNEMPKKEEGKENPEGAEGTEGGEPGAEGEEKKPQIPTKPVMTKKKKKPSKRVFKTSATGDDFDVVTQPPDETSLGLEEVEARMDRRQTRRIIKPMTYQPKEAKKGEQKPTPQQEKMKAAQENEFYICPKCKEIPALSMSKETAIKVDCKCAKDKTCQIMHLDSFIKEMEKPKEIPNCSIENKHSKPVKSTKYCPQCKKFFCDACIADHDNFQQHISINSMGLLINANCENDACKTKGNIEFYCATCRLHLCSKCKSDHKKKHDLKDIYQVVNDVYFSELEESIAEIEETMKTETDFFKEVIQVEKVIENCKKLIKQRDEENRGIIRYFKSLINAYKSTRGIMNYNVRQNGISSDIKKVYAFSKIHFRYKFRNELVQSKLFKFLSHTKNYFNIINEYDIKTKDQVKEINTKEMSKGAKEKDILKDYPDYYRIFGYDMEKKNDFTELNEENSVMLIDDVIVPFTRKFNPNMPPGKHKVEIMSKGPTNVITNFKNMFEGCKSLSAADLSNYDTSGVTDMKGMFCMCRNLTSVNLKNFDTSQVTDMKGMFVKCTSLPQLDLSFFDTSKVTDMKCMFNGCTALTSLDLSNFDTSKVKDMNRMFTDCSAIKEMDLYNFETPLCEDMKQMFYGCFTMTSLDISNFNTTEVSDMDEMFCNCACLTDLKINMESKVKKMKDIFYNCGKLDQATKDKFKKKGWFG